MIEKLIESVKVKPIRLRRCRRRAADGGAARPYNRAPARVTEETLQGDVGRGPTGAGGTAAAMFIRF